MFLRFCNKFDTLTWEQVNRRFADEYPNALSLFDLVLTIPATSTDCERGFTHMKLVKSDRRSLMTEDTLTNCLTIKLEGPPLEQFDPVPAIDHWFNLVPRRPRTSGSAENKSGEKY